MLARSPGGDERELSFGVSAQSVRAHPHGCGERELELLVCLDELANLSQRSPVRDTTHSDIDLQAELLENWRRARSGETLKEIAPLQ